MAVVNRRYVQSVLVALVYACAGAVMAQDMAAVSPSTTKVLIDKPDVRVMEVNVKPGEGIPMHSHPENVVYFVTGGKIKTTTSDGKVTEVTRKPGEVMWSAPITHKNENVGTTEEKVIVIELKSAK
ncbi:cupin domain-containing protein [Dyella humicola]|uniref:cupin domain-containing protein n=1 Tax=Dyella humicola TaxID=2992126 RepID=UPI00225112CD|nr:cupin domain-containing protein [Dyella humicola]